MKTIVALVDFTDVSFKVLKQAYALGKAFGGEVVILHVAPQTRAVGSIETGDIMTDPSPERLRSDQTKLKGLTDMLLRAGAKVSAEEVQGTAIDKILEESRRLNADLIIMGAHHHVFLYDWFVSDLAVDVVKAVPCPVLVVPNEDWSEGGMKIILALVDPSDVAAAILKQTRDLARVFDGEVVILHVLPEPDLTEVGDAGAEAKVAENLWQKEHSKLTAMCEEMAGTGTRVTMEELTGPTTEVILEEGQRLGADLIVMGSHHHSVVYNLFVGDVTNEVLKLADRPVLVVPINDGAQDKE
jgi:nucleotide-binding universal stress UspA family protein